MVLENTYQTVELQNSRTRNNFFKSENGCRGLWVSREWRMTIWWDGVSFWGEVVMATPPREHTKYRWIVHLKMVSFMVRELDHDIFKESEK